jgi:hypothetical protein
MAGIDRMLAQAGLLDLGGVDPEFRRDRLSACTLIPERSRGRTISTLAMAGCTGLSRAKATRTQA